MQNKGCGSSEGDMRSERRPGTAGTLFRGAERAEGRWRSAVASVARSLGSWSTNWARRL